MAATASAAADLRQSAEPEESNVSSPLSEVDDKDSNDGAIDHMDIDGDAVEKTHASDDEIGVVRNNGDASESESALSEAGSDLDSAANDTEAETERLYDTPRNQRQRDVVVDQFNRGQVFEHTPSKLRSAAAAGGIDDNESVSGDDASEVSSADELDDSPTKKLKRANAVGEDDDSKQDSQGRKRKRSSGPDQSESDQPLRKRLGSVAAASDDDDETGTNDDEKLAAQLRTGQHSDGDEDEDSLNNRDTATEGEGQERETRSSKRGTRSSSKRSALVKDEDETGTDVPDETAEATAEDTEQPNDDAEADADEEEEEDEADVAARNQEEQERKQAAFKDWEHIEEMFGIFRDRLYKERLQRLEDEEQSLLADVPTHREYLNMKQCLDDRLNQKTQEFNTEFDFQLKAHDRWAVAQRAQIWSQFFQAVREKREQTLESLNKQWYDVQTARRTAHSLPDYGLLFPRDHTQRVRNAIAYNTEVSTLAGLAKFEGFPAGPEMKGASTTELKADFAAMERTRKARQRPTFHSREDGLGRLGPAGEQFLKDTPWANPSHSAHKISQTPVENGQGPSQSPVSAAQNLPPHADIKTPFDGAATQKSPALSTKLSESQEMSRNLLNPAAHQMKRMGSVPSIGRGSKTAAV